MSGSGKSEQENVPHFLHKKWKPVSFLDVSRCSHVNQRQGNVQESVLQLDLLLVFTVLVKGIQRLIFHISLTGLGYFSKRVKRNPKILGFKNVMKEGIWKIIFFVIR